MAVAPLRAPSPALTVEAKPVAAVHDRRSEAENAREVAPEDSGLRPLLQPEPLPVDDGPPIFDEAAESAFRAEARDRGETVVATMKASEPEDAEPNGTLPALDALVQRIPADVRETLEDLFRARFVRVQRVPRKHLKK